MRPMNVDTRRDFLKKALLMASGGGGAAAFTAALDKALGIDPAPGSTYRDAEHVVILMQENRSFDHLFGSLQGVRGFSDPRAITLPDGLPVWCQSNAAGETYVPFPLDLQGTKATWMSCLPHSWADQAAARHEGRHDRWLSAKPSGVKEYAAMPLTLGYCERRDLPFHYAFADAFTVCDQAFCSSLTGTTANRLYLWSGTIRPDRDPAAPAHVNNADTDYHREVSWTSFPERLEEAGISWRVYQNEISLASGLQGEEDAWLTNFTDNPLEWFRQYHVRAAAPHRAWLGRREAELGAAEAAAVDQGQAAEAAQALAKIRRQLAEVEDFDRLEAKAQSLHQRAFTTNVGDPRHRQLSAISWQDGDQVRSMKVPAGDVLHQFREDVAAGALPTVSWLVAPQHFSDHPSSPFYGSWYLAETLGILTKNPAVWQKTIFILCYDENDGYFDHVPPFVAPQPGRPETGGAAPGLETELEHVAGGASPGPIGLGYRVPLVIASPWSRGGRVCSQVFDHTSILQFLEVFLSHKTGRAIREPNLTAWRRAVCGDLTSAFRPWQGEAVGLPAALEREAVLRVVHQAQFKPVPGGFRPLGAEELAQARRDFAALAVRPRQEAGTRPSAALPYELAVQGALGADRRHFALRLAAGKARFGDRAAGAAFHVYTPSRVRGLEGADWVAGRAWAFAAAAGTEVSGQWPLEDFVGGSYDLRVHGPNGFFAAFAGDAGDPPLSIQWDAAPGAAPVLRLRLQGLREGGAGRGLTVIAEDLSYQYAPRRGRLEAGAALQWEWALGATQGWYDFRVAVGEAPRFWQRFAGRLETGRDSVSDPAMAG